jgi:hypothetical protein
LLLVIAFGEKFAPFNEQLGRFLPVATCTGFAHIA